MANPDTTRAATTAPQLIAGDDDIRRSRAARLAAHQILDRHQAPVDFALCEFDAATADEAEIFAALRTPPLLVSVRVVIVRNAEKLDGSRLTDYLTDPEPTTALILEVPTAQPPTELARLVRKAGGSLEVLTQARNRSQRERILATELHGRSFDLDRDARAAVVSRFGDETGRIAGLLDTLEAAHSAGAVVTAADVEDLLGSAGGVAPWAVADAVAAGNPAEALRELDRQLATGADPYGIVAILRSRYLPAFRSSAGMTSAGKVKISEPARRLATKLGPNRSVRALELCARAEAQLRGASGLSGPVVSQILVGRLAALHTS